MDARRTAFTLVELLVVLAILGTLLSMLLPAIQGARESGRCSACQNNLKQISLGLLSHHEAQQHFPSGGWGHEWVGVPGRGSGDEQPGGWIYSALPNLEQIELHNLGLYLDAAQADDAFSRRLMTPLTVFTCPSRRTCDIWPAVPSYVRSPKPHGQVSRVARSDYAINGGSSRALSWPGPASMSEGDSASYWKRVTYSNGFSGISHLHASVNLVAVIDGASKTYLVGEKSADPQHYEDGAAPGDNKSMYAGYCLDLHRFTGNVDNANPFLPPTRDAYEQLDPPRSIRFGSAHYSGLFMAFCDGSVRFIDYDIDPEVHLRSGHRSDAGRPLNVLK